MHIYRNTKLTHSRNKAVIALSLIDKAVMPMLHRLTGPADQISWSIIYVRIRKEKEIDKKNVKKAARNVPIKDGFDYFLRKISHNSYSLFFFQTLLFFQLVNNITSQ